MRPLLQVPRYRVLNKSAISSFSRFSGATLKRMIATTPTSNNDVRTTNPEMNTTEHPSDGPEALPAPEDGSKAIKITVDDDQGVKLDLLGPMVVNRDGTLSRISNWSQMTPIERQNTLRILGKRNQLRVEALKAGNDEKPPAK